MKIWSFSLFHALMWGQLQICVQNGDGGICRNGFVLFSFWPKSDSLLLQLVVFMHSGFSCQHEGLKTEIWAHRFTSGTQQSIKQHQHNHLYAQICVQDFKSCSHAAHRDDDDDDYQKMIKCSVLTQHLYKSNNKWSKEKETFYFKSKCVFWTRSLDLQSASFHYKKSFTIHRKKPRSCLKTESFMAKPSTKFYLNSLKGLGENFKHYQEQKDYRSW